MPKAEQIRSFAEAFFSHFEAQLEPQRDELVVTLSPELAEAFGKPKLYLVFPTDSAGEVRDLSPTEDLLTYGSRTFDQMLALLAHRGEAARLHFAVMVEPAANAAPLPLHNCHLVDNEIAARDALFYIFNFRAVYLSDEKREQFMTIAMDEDGQIRPDIAEFITHFDSQPRLPDTGQPMKSQALRTKYSQAAAAAQELLRDETANQQQAIEARLQKVLLRLDTYYQRLLDEVNPDDPEQAAALRHDLQQDLAHKVAGELERHRLRLTLSPVSFALAVVPVAGHTLTLAARQTRQLVKLTQNLHNGQVELLACHHCQQPVETLALCDHNHLVHAHCLDTCHRCDKDVCRQCGIQSCAICSQPVCFGCMAPCAYDDRWLCAEHIQRCAICGTTFCPDHTATCGVCHQTYCPTCVVSECTTCRTALSGKIAAGLHPPAIPGQTTSRLQWRSAENQAYTVYIGQYRHVMSVLGRMVVVTDNAGEVVFWTKSGLLKWLT